MVKEFFAAVLAAAAYSASSAAVAAEPANKDAGADDVQVMVVGSFHMGNPGQDIVNAEVANMLTPRRQAELAAVAEALAAFRPTAIAVERVSEPPEYLDQKFTSFSADDLLTVADERYQVAYRLAALAGVTRVYGIDEQPSEGEPDYFPFGKLAAHAEATGQSEALNAQIAGAQEMVKRFNALQKDSSVAELLIMQNDYDGLSNPAFYYGAFRYDRGEDQLGAELQAYWFMRNAKIFSKLAQVTQPGDRVVIVYGSGHKHWLEHFAEQTPGYAKVDPVPYLENAVD